MRVRRQQPVNTGIDPVAAADKLLAMPFTTATLHFFRGLARNNRKPWFEAHRAEYDGVVVAPMRELIEEMDVRLASFAPEITGDPKRSMFRIYRDIRFSKDKSPYKTHAACWFYHKDGSRAVGREAAGGGAGFYFQIAPGSCFTGGGMWMPPKEALHNLRDADHPAARWLRLQSFTLGRELRDAQALGARLPALLAADFRLIVPLVRWINDVLGLQAAERR